MRVRRRLGMWRCVRLSGRWLGTRTRLFAPSACYYRVLLHPKSRFAFAFDFDKIRNPGFLVFLLL